MVVGAAVVGSVAVVAICWVVICWVVICWIAGGLSVVGWLSLVLLLLMVLM